MVINDKAYMIDDGLIVFSMNGDLRMIQVRKYESPFTVVCGRCERFEHKQLLICRDNYTNKRDGDFIIPDIFIAKLIAHRDKPDSDKQVSLNFSYLGATDELETPSRAIETPSCKTTATLLRVITALLIDHNLEGGGFND